MPSNDRRARLRDHLLPAPDDALLLAAAFAEERDFEEAFAAWAGAVGQAPRRSSYALIQLLAPRLRGHAAGDALVDLCRSQYRLVWAKTRLLERRHAAILARLDRVGLSALVLKGPALQPLYYRDAGLRAMGDLDLLVPHDRFAEAITCLVGAGWRSEKFDDPRQFDVRFGRAVELINDAGDLVDIHAHPFHQRAGWAEATRLFWARARPMTLGGVAALTLAPEHHLILQIEHATADTEPNPRWIADGLAIVRSGEVDWSILVEDGKALGLHGLIVDGLRILATFGAAIPAGVLTPDGATAGTLSVASEAPVSIAARLRHHAAAMRHASRQSGLGWLRLLPAYLRFRLAGRKPWRKRGRPAPSGRED